MLTSCCCWILSPAEGGPCCVPPLGTASPADRSCLRVNTMCMDINVFISLNFMKQASLCHFSQIPSIPVFNKIRLLFNKEASLFWSVREVKLPLKSARVRFPVTCASLHRPATPRGSAEPRQRTCVTAAQTSCPSRGAGTGSQGRAELAFPAAAAQGRQEKMGF